MGGGRDKTPRHKAPGAGKHAKQDTTGAQRGGEGEKKQKEKKNQQQPQTGQPQPGGGRTSKERSKNGRRKGGRRPPRAPSCRPHSAQSQLARVRAVGLVTAPHARTPPHPQPVGSGPRQPAQRAGSRGWESARTRTPHTQAGGDPPGSPRAAPTARKASSQERALWGWSRVPTPAPPRTHSQWVVGPGSPLRGRAVGGGRAHDPRRPTPRQEAPPRAPSCRPHSTQESALWGC